MPLWRIEFDYSSSISRITTRGDQQIADPTSGVIWDQLAVAWDSWALAWGSGANSDTTLGVLWNNLAVTWESWTLAWGS